MSCGTPIIVTDQCGSADLAREGGGIVCECSSQSIFQAMVHMLKVEEKRETYGKNGKLLMKENYTWEKITERLEGVYSNVVKGWDHNNIEASK